jgi:hypothetical protein
MKFRVTTVRDKRFNPQRSMMSVKALEFHWKEIIQRLGL